MLYRISICDDELSQIKIVEDYLTRFSIKTETEFHIEKFSSGNELLKKYYNEKSPFDNISNWWYDIITDIMIITLFEYMLCADNI